MAPCVVVWLVVGAGCDAAEDQETPTWSYLHAAIIETSCATASCHSQISSISGRDMSTPEHAYAAVTMRTCNAPMLPGEPPPEIVQFVLIDTLLGYGQSASGEPLLMPPEQRLPDAEIELFVRWYEAGAKCD